MENKIFSMLLLSFSTSFFAIAFKYISDMDYEMPLSKLSMKVFELNKTVWKALFGCVYCASFWYHILVYPLFFKVDIYMIYFGLVSLGITISIKRDFL